jgi:competence protein ComEA
MQMNSIIHNGLQSSSINLYSLTRRVIMFRQLIALLATVCALNAFAAVDVNQASRAELESVKGIGPSLSGKITEARKAGAFKDWSDLVDRVGGIGPGNAARMSQGGLTVAGSAYEGSAKAQPGASTAKLGKGDKSADKTAEKVRAPRKAKAGEEARS